MSAKRPELVITLLLRTYPDFKPFPFFDSFLILHEGPARSCVGKVGTRLSMNFYDQFKQWATDKGIGIEEEARPGWVGMANKSADDGLFSGVTN